MLGGTRSIRGGGDTVPDGFLMRIEVFEGREGEAWEPEGEFYRGRANRVSKNNEMKKGNCGGLAYR